MSSQLLLALRSLLFNCKCKLFAALSVEIFGDNLVLKSTQNYYQRKGFYIHMFLFFQAEEKTNMTEVTTCRTSILNINTWDFMQKDT